MNLNQLPDNLPVPVNDGAAEYLKGTQLPNASFTANKQQIGKHPKSARSRCLLHLPDDRPSRNPVTGWMG